MVPLWLAGSFGLSREFFVSLGDARASLSAGQRYGLTGGVAAVAVHLLRQR